MSEILSWIHTNAELAFTLVLVINALLTAFIILLENREPEKSLAWFLALLVFPLVGFIFYLFFGRDWHKRSYQQRRLVAALTHKRRKQLSTQTAHWKEGSPLEQSIRRLDATTTGLDPTDGNHVRILTDAQEKYPRLLSAIRHAKKAIDIEYYIFRDDETGQSVIEALKERARAGVHVRFLVDGMGSIGFGRKRFAEMRDAGIDCHYFSPLATLFYFFKANYRDHRKIVVIDDEIAFTGGINIGNEYLGNSERGAWRDTSIELRGPCVAQFTDLFEEAWHATTNEAQRRVSPAPPFAEGVTVDVVASGPDSAWTSIHQQYLALIHGAQKQIRIQTPYFIPDESLFMALILASLRGVEVELMLPRKPDWQYLRWVAQTYLESLLRAGVRVYEYQTGFLHTKAFIVDNQVASLGTCNVDIRSLRLDFEVNVLLSDAKSIAHLNEDFEQDVRHCEELEYAAFIDRPFVSRVVGSLSRLISPLL